MCGGARQVKYWFITSIAKLLLFTYVAFEAVLGLSATVGGGLSRAAYGRCARLDTI